MHIIAISFMFLAVANVPKELGNLTKLFIVSETTDYTYAGTCVIVMFLSMLCKHFF